MLPELEKLLVLQERDRRILALQQEMARIPIERAEIERRAQEETALVESLKLQTKKIESDRKSIDLEIEGKKGQISKYQIQQFQTKKNEEYQALTHEIERAKEEIDELETRELELMVKADEVHAALKTEQAKLADMENQFQSQRETLAQREAAINKELRELKADRDARSKDIPEDVCEKYERIKRSKGASAIVGVEHGNCQGCHLAVTPTVLHQVKSGREIVTCENCARILYWMD
jgi:predicted  nucleic acid-binding Zn-ribbon protein